MTPYWSLNGSRLYQGHVLDVLKNLGTESVHCIVTSPPYWGLRDYGLPPVEWPAVRYAPMAGLPEVEVTGCDPECGAPWERVTERVQRVPWSERKAKGATGGSKERGYNENHGQGTDHTLGVSVTTTGWRPTCTCNQEDAGDPELCTVLDPFSGSGTTLDVARQLGRRWVGIELSKDYCDNHIIPRLAEPLLEWAEQEQVAAEIEQMEMAL